MIDACNIQINALSLIVFYFEVLWSPKNSLTVRKTILLQYLKQWCSHDQIYWTCTTGWPIVNSQKNWYIWRSHSKKPIESSSALLLPEAPDKSATCYASFFQDLSFKAAVLARTGLSFALWPCLCAVATAAQLSFAPALPEWLLPDSKFSQSGTIQDMWASKAYIRPRGVKSRGSKTRFIVGTKSRTSSTTRKLLRTSWGRWGRVEALAKAARPAPRTSRYGISCSKSLLQARKLGKGQIKSAIIIEWISIESSCEVAWFCWLVVRNPMCLNYRLDWFQQDVLQSRFRYRCKLQKLKVV